MGKLLPNGVLGHRGDRPAGRVHGRHGGQRVGFNTVFTYDIWQAYIRQDRPDAYYLRVGRVVTVVGVLIGIGTAFIAAGYSNIMNYIQALFSIFNAPLFATFIIGMFWKRTTPWAGFWGLLAGTVGAAVAHFAFTGLDIGSWDVSGAAGCTIESTQSQNFYGAVVAFVADAVVTVAVTLVTAAETGTRAGRAWSPACPTRTPRRRDRSRSGGGRRSCSASARWASPSSSA